MDEEFKFQVIYHKEYTYAMYIPRSSSNNMRKVIALLLFIDKYGLCLVWLADYKGLLSEIPDLLYIMFLIYIYDIIRLLSYL